MPVFISHKREDSEYAAFISSFLELRGVRTYLDVLDPTLQSTEDITAALVQRIAGCTHLMAVVSQYTVQSWWVPFEIGVATEKSRRISTYHSKTASELPDYLSKWPILRKMSDLEAYVKCYKMDVSASLEERGSTAPLIQTAAEFHKLVKAAIRG